MKEWVLILSVFADGASVTPVIVDGFGSTEACMDAGMKIMKTIQSDAKEAEEMGAAVGIKKPAGTFTCADLKK